MGSAEYAVTGDELDRVVELRGALALDTVSDLEAELRRLLTGGEVTSVVLDFEAVSAIDDTGVALLHALESTASREGIRMRRRNLPAHVEEFIRFSEAHVAPDEPYPRAPRVGPATHLGRWIVKKVREARDLTVFVGEMAITFAAGFVRPSKWRLREVFYQFQVNGAHAIPLVFLLTFLTGIIVAFQAVKGLHGFGNPIFVADIVTESTARRMAPLMTAIILAGRSGAAYAAELGTMTVNEEIDALRVMGFRVTAFLVLPRVLALVLAAPLLVMLADLAGVLGGASIGWMLLHLSPLNFLSEVRHALHPFQIWSGLLKGVTYGGLVGITGCFLGLRAGRAPEQVGVMATAAVVTSILLIIMADTLYSTIFSLYGL